MLLVQPNGSLSRAGDVGSFVMQARKKSDDEIAALPKNPEQNSVHTEWRDKVYHFWNHVFYDVGNWLSSQFSSTDGVSHFQPPSTEAIGLEFPASSANDSGTHIWDRDVFLVPAHVHTGVSLRLLAVDEATPPEVPETSAERFDNWSQGDIYYVRRQTKVRFVVEGEPTEAGSDLAAVVVCGQFCAADDDDPDDPPGRPEQKALSESEMEEEMLQQEVQSSMQNVFAAFLLSRRTTDANPSSES
jgi:hypothetical protein